MKKIAFFNSKSYDIESFNEIISNYNYDITYFGFKLTEKTAAYTKGFDAVCCFVNDDLNKMYVKYYTRMVFELFCLDAQDLIKLI